MTDIKTIHRLIKGNAQELSFISKESVHLVVTSPPYWTLKRYRENPDQMGHIEDYEEFIGKLDADEGLLIHLDVPVIGLSEDAVFNIRDISGELDNVKIVNQHTETLN